MKHQFSMILAVLGAALLAPATAAAMCGCMMPVDDTGIPESTQLTSDATQVVMMRHGTTTVQTMQNRYEGPLENFAIVIPTPEVLTEEQVKTLKPEVFEDIDRVSAPRLTEYWQHDPCEEVPGFAGGEATTDASSNNVAGGNNDSAPPRDGGVVVEAEFAVGEYEIQILSAEEGIGLETWLTDNGYRVPQGASKYLQPYIDGGMYFFVAKVNVDEVNFVDGSAVLSPLRFHYDQDDFMLPTRLGMMNSNGRQDLIVYALGETRFEAANHPNATIPTNVSVSEQVKNDFGSFYDQLLEKTLEAHGNAVITEYAAQPWELRPEDVSALGADALVEQDPNFNQWNMVLSRLHFRYAKDDLGEDVIFRTAGGIVGGQEAWNDRGTVDPTLMKQGVEETEWNSFRAQYIIKHHWDGKVECANPVYSRWGGNPDAEAGSQPEVAFAMSPNSTNKAVFEAQGKSALPVDGLVEEDVPEIGLERSIPPKGDASTCSSARTPGDAIPFGLLALALGFIGVYRRR